MRVVIIFIIVGILLLAAVVILAFQGISNQPNVTLTPPQTETPKATALFPTQSSVQTASPSAQNINTEITSTSFEHNQLIPARFTCDGLNISPPLTITNVPSGTVSLALSVRDPDAPAGTFTHWVVWNINPKSTRLPERAALPGATQGTNDGNRVGYTGPCPPSGTHHYIFTVHALDSKINLTRDATYPEFQKALQGHVVSQGELIGLYSR